MLSITILAVGGLKEQYLQAACAEYSKRLSAYCKLHIVEIPEYRLSSAPSPAEIEQGLQMESKQILGKIPKNAHIIPLCIEGPMLSSQQLAAKFEAFSVQTSHLAFIIGGSYGLSSSIKEAAHLQLSMSKMTFPHQLARVMLLEQIYRAMSIRAGAKYHK